MKRRVRAPWYTDPPSRNDPLHCAGCRHQRDNLCHHPRIVNLERKKPAYVGAEVSGTGKSLPTWCPRVDEITRAITTGYKEGVLEDGHFEVAGIIPDEHVGLVRKPSENDEEFKERLQSMVGKTRAGLPGVGKWKP